MLTWDWIDSDHEFVTIEHERFISDQLKHPISVDQFFVIYSYQSTTRRCSVFKFYHVVSVAQRDVPFCSRLIESFDAMQTSKEF